MPYTGPDRLHTADSTHNDTTINVMMLFVGGWDVHAHCCMLECLNVKRCEAEPLGVVGVMDGQREGGGG